MRITVWIWLATGLLISARIERAQAQAVAGVDVKTIGRIVGVEPVVKDGAAKVTVPQNDLHVTVDGFRILPPMGLGTWAAFTPAADRVVLTGDVVVTEDEVAPVMKTLVENGLTVTALHKHFVRERPRVLYLHVGGEGTVEELARGVRAVLDRVAEIRGVDPAEAPADSVGSALDVSALAAILGHEGESSRGVYKVTVGRPDVSAEVRGAPLTAFAGFNTWAAFQGTAEEAAVSGDFAMLADEVAPVVESLVGNGIEIVSVHQHMVHEEPRIFFLHYWGRGPALDLARAIRAGLDRTGGAPGS
jgi:hypothetical protein